MSALPGSLVPIFATPFGSLALPVDDNLNERLRKKLLLIDVDANADRKKTNNPLLFQGSDDFFEQRDPDVVAIRTHILRGVSQVAVFVSGQTEQQFSELSVEARAWPVIVRPNGRVPAVDYGLAAWLAIYCVAAPKLSLKYRDNGCLRLYETRLGNCFVDASTATLRAPFNFGHHTWSPVAGCMAVFPASHPHEVCFLNADSELVFLCARVRFRSVDVGINQW